MNKIISTRSKNSQREFSVVRALSQILFSRDSEMNIQRVVTLENNPVDEGGNNHALRFKFRCMKGICP